MASFYNFKYNYNNNWSCTADSNYSIIKQSRTK